MLEIRGKLFSLSLSLFFDTTKKKQILKQNASKLSVPVRAIEAEEDIVDNEIIALRKELRKAQVLKTVLASECKRATKRSGDAKRCMEAVKNLKSTLDGEGEDNLSLDKLFSELSTDVGALRQLETRMNGMDSLFIIRLLSAQTDLNTHTNARTNDRELSRVVLQELIKVVFPRPRDRGKVSYTKSWRKGQIPRQPCRV